ncbi:MAG: YggT family protein [Nitrospirae bacterium]|nr:YggT family protein [Nitrospirota bacterium]
MNIVIFQLINYTLSFLMWMIVGRFILSRIIGGRQNIILSAFIKLTEPVFRVTKKILPFAKAGFIPFFSIVLIIIIRLMLIVFFKPGTLPK